MRDSQFDQVNTAANGAFTLSQEQLQANEGRKVFLWAGQPDKVGYKIHMDDPFQKVSRQLADEAIITIRGTAESVQSNDQQLQGMEKTIALNAVTIKVSKSNNFLSGFSGGGPNACGDYVCQYGSFNCPVHTPWNSRVRAPVKGEKVATLNYGNNHIYQGCTTTNTQQTFGIYTAKEFYGLDRDPTSSSMTQYLSTLFWKPGIISNEKGELLFSFFTGDISGKFLIIMQGVGKQGMIYGDDDFSVK